MDFVDCDLEFLSECFFEVFIDDLLEFEPISKAFDEIGIMV